MRQILILAAGVVALAIATSVADEPQPEQRPQPEEKPLTTNPAPSIDQMPPARVKLETTLGEIVLELDAKRAPHSVSNFLHYVKDGHYAGTIFHRVIPTFMIQGGGYDADLREKGKLRAPIKNEWQNGLKNVRGSIAMARTNAPDSATAQFFINVVDNAALDMARPQTGNAAYAVFGKVVDGMDVVDKIRDTPTKEDGRLPMGPVVPVEPVVIKSATIVGTYDLEALDAAIKAQEAK